MAAVVGEARPGTGDAAAQARPAALEHAAVLVEALVFDGRRLGLLPRTSSAEDPLGPIVVSDEDVRTILAGFRRGRDEPHEDPLAAQKTASREALAGALAAPGAERLGLARLSAGLALTPAELDALVLALSPDWDRRFGRLFGFLNNDATKERPTVGHVAQALSLADAPGALDRLEEWGLLLVERAPLVPHPNRTVLVPMHVVRIALAPLDPRGDGRPPLPWDRVHLAEPEKGELRELLGHELRARPGERPALVLLEAATGAGRRTLVEAVAAEAGVAVVHCDLPGCAGTARSPEEELSGAFLRARALDAALILRSDGVLGREERLAQHLHRLAASLPVRCFVLARVNELAAVDVPLPVVRLDVPHPDAPARRRIWVDALAASRLDIPAPLVADASARYDLVPGRIREVVAELADRAGTTGAQTLTMRDTRDALRRITTRRLMDLATPFEGDLELGDLVLPRMVSERLEELIHRIRHRYQVMTDWGFGTRSARGEGVAALFSGPPGTGKTAAAGAIAKALDVNLYVVNLASIMSKWVGETEENLARVFGEAEASSVALLFDEADSLFGKRSSEMRSANDRFANVTINYLLQRMETYQGLAILTTNLESAIDAAFSRRITSRVMFPAPDEELRRRLWEKLLPPGASFADGVDLAALAADFKLPGSRVKTALRRAAFRAAAGGRAEPVLEHADLLWAAENEYRDIGLLGSAVSGSSPRR